MRDDQHRFLMLLGQLPARLTAEQAAWVLNCQPHDVPVLVAARLLKPLGSSAPNSVKYFAASEVLELAKDGSWLAKVTNAVSQHWKAKNLRKNACSGFAEDHEGAVAGSTARTQVWFDWRLGREDFAPDCSQVTNWLKHAKKEHTRGFGIIQLVGNITRKGMLPCGPLSLY